MTASFCFIILMMKCPYKKILVTGGAGFIGSWLIRHLLDRFPEIEIINLDLLTYAGNLENLNSVSALPNYRFIQGDIRDRALVESLVQDVDACVNVAAQTHVDRSILEPDVFVSTNVLGTQILLEAARMANIQKFVQISTDEVYGSLGPDGLFSETSTLCPSSPYSASKAGADHLVMSYHKTYGLPVNITRCSNNYGPNQYPEKLIPLFILNALSNKELPVYGNGLNVRDWIHVSDHSDAVARVLCSGKPGEIYNVGASSERNNLEITRLILQILNKPETLIRFVEDRLGHDYRYAIDSRKIQQDLAWYPQVDFQQGIENTISWYIENAEWIRNIQHRSASLI